MTSSLVTVYLSPVWVLAQCWLLTLAFSIWVTVPTSTLSWSSFTWHWPTKIYTHPSLSLMLPFNIGLPKTPHGLFLDRCHEPCPSVIPNTDQPRLNQDYWVSTWCYLNTSLIKTTASWCLSWGWSQSSFTRWQTPPIPALVGVSSNGVTFRLFWKITGIFRVIASFTPPFLKYNCQYFIKTIGLEFVFWLIGLTSQWAYLIINHKLCTICLWTHSDGAHGGRHTLSLPTPIHTYPYPPYPYPPLPLPTPTHPYPYLPPPTPTPTYPYPPLPLPTPTHPYPYHPYYKLWSWKKPIHKQC